MTHPLRLGLLACLVIISAAYLFSVLNRPVLASAPSGLVTHIASTTNLSMAAVTPLLMAATSTCDSRIISTGGSSIMLTFTDAQGKRASGIQGYPQAASTTVAYDSGIYGCDAVYGFSYVAGVVTVSEAR